MQAKFTEELLVQPLSDGTTLVYLCSAETAV